MDIELAQRIKFEHLPEALYRYRSFSDKNIENLEKSNGPFQDSIILFL
jgi:hypothetical protein